MEKTYDLIIIGAGPNGINCGIHAREHQLDYLILEKGVLVNSLYNFPTNMTFFSTSVNLEIGETPFISHTDKPTRKEALEYYRRLAQSHQLNIKYQTEVIGMERVEERYRIQTKSDTYYSNHVIINTGFYSHPNNLNVKGEHLTKVKHYYDEAHPYIGSKLVIVGGANSACDVALETWQKGADVTMVVRKPDLYEKVKYWILPNIKNRIQEGSITAHFNSELIEIQEKHVLIKTPKETLQLENDYVLAMTGYRPDYALFSKLKIKVEDDENKTPIYNPLNYESNLPGVYLSGVILGGLQTSKYFIENTRDQARIIIEDIVAKT